MTNDNTPHHHKNILEGLESAGSIKLIETLGELRVSGKASDIPMLIELLHLSHDPEIKSKITDLFANLKESDAIPPLIEAIQNQRYAPELKELVSSCWENGLDYSDYLSQFVDLLIETEFLIAFEAYTVILNMTTRIEQAKLAVEIDRLEKSIPTATEQKRQLLIDVIDFLPSMAL